MIFQNANYVDIDQIYPLPLQDRNSNYNRNSSPIYQNTSDKSLDTTPIYSNTNLERYSNQIQMSYGESLAHHLRHSIGRSESQGTLTCIVAISGLILLPACEGFKYLSN